MSAYVELTALKEAVGLTGQSNDTIDDAILRSCIHRASAMVDGWLDRNRPGYVGFAASSNSRTSVGSNTRRYDGSGDDWLWIDDASSIASVTVDDVAVLTTDYDVWPYNETPKRAVVYIQPTSSLRGLRPGHWTVGTGNVDVVGYFGLDHVPDDVAQTALAVAIIYWRRYQQGQPEPVVSPSGATGFLVQDPEVDGILESGLAGWRVIGVWGA